MIASVLLGGLPGLVCKTACHDTVVTPSQLSRLSQGQLVLKLQKQK